MSLYPPPSANVPVFNPALFTNINGGVSYGSVGVGNALAFPVAQGAEIWTNGTETATLDSGTVSLTTITGVTSQGITLGANGFAYNDGITTTTGLWRKVQAVGALSSASNATTLNVNNTIQIQNGETTAPPTSFIALEAGSNQLQMNLCQNGVTPQYGTAGQVLTSGGSAGSMTWGSGGGGSVGTLNDVLINGNTTTQDGTTFTDLVTGENVLIQGNKLRYTLPAGFGQPPTETQIDNFVKVRLIDNTYNTYMGYDRVEAQNVVGGTITRLTTTDLSIEDGSDSATLSKNGLFFYSSLPGPVGIGANPTIGGLQLTTNGVLWFQGLTGSVGQVLTRNNDGYSVWQTPPAIRSGVIAISTSSTTGSVTFSTAITTTNEPAVTFGMITGASTIFVNIGVVSITGTANNWTGFNYRTTATATTADVQKAYWIAVPLNL